MRIGIPKERKTLEKRVALTPQGAKTLTESGHEILIEKGAGSGSFFEDSEYLENGCKIIDSLRDVWENSELIVKVKEPCEEEFKFFRKDLLLFDYLHLASMPDLTKRMLNSGISGIAYELIRSSDNRLPLLEPMSDIAGKLSVLNGSYFLFSQHGGRGVLLSGTDTVEPGVTVIVGAGIAGIAACETALNLGSKVYILDINNQRLEDLKLRFNNKNLVTLKSDENTLKQVCKEADLLIGAVLLPGASAPKIIKKDMIKSMKKGAVFVDISIDQGGCSETIKATDLLDPVYTLFDVIHYGVCNIPALTPQTSTLALTKQTLPYIKKIADTGASIINDDNQFKDALCTHNGKLTNEAIAKSLGFDYEEM